VTAQLECLLDDVVFGKQPMVGAIDAVCAVAQRIIGKLKDGLPNGEPPLLASRESGAAADRPPTAAMKRFADSIGRQKGIKPPPGYTKSGSVCRAFLEKHAPKKVGDVQLGAFGPQPASPAQVIFAEKIAQEKGVVVPDEAKVSSAAMSSWIAAHQNAKPSKVRPRSGAKCRGGPAAKTTTGARRSRKPKSAPAAEVAAPTPAQPKAQTNTPLRIPYGNKELALKLGARYGAGGWYAPPGVDLAAFGEQGWW
jgi:DNA topoisomerase-3